MMFRADLHTHTTCSDGTLTPIELLDLAKERGLSGISVTDHDTIDAYTPAFFGRALKLGISVLPGVEFSTMYKDHPIHILAYGFDLKSKHIIDFCARHLERRLNRNLSILAKLRKHGIPIQDKQLYTTDESRQVVKGRVHIANLLVDGGYVGSLNDAFKRLIGDGKECFDSGVPFTVAETVDVIHASHGKAFIAHPHLVKKRRIVKELLGHWFNGIECYYCKMPLDQEEPWLKLADQHGLLVSGGSDFHGANRPHTQLGCSWVDKETFERIKRHD